MSEGESSRITQHKDNNRFIINKIELIYLHIKDETLYHKRFKWLVMIIVIIANSYLWSLLFKFAPIRQNIYKYNPRFNQLERISLDSLCEHWETKFNFILYNDNSNLCNVTHFDDELMKVNKQYVDFFFNHSMNIFSVKTNNLARKFEPLYYKFNAAVVLTANEGYNLLIKYNDICDSNSSLIYFSVFILFGSLLGNFVVSLIADIIGRRKVLLICLILCTVASTCFFLLSILLDISIENHKYDSKLPKDSTIYEIYKTYDINQFTYKSYNNYKIFLSVCLFFINLSIIAVKNIIYAIFVEKCLNDNLVYRSHIWYNVSLSIAIFWAFLLNFVFKDFKYIYIINAAILFLCTLFIIFFVGESPRYLFDIGDWKGLTEFFYRYFDVEKLSNLTCSQEKFDLIKRYEENLLKERDCLVRDGPNNFRANRAKRMSSFFFQINLAKMYKELSSKDENFIINKEDLITNPFIIHIFMFNDIHIRKNLPILLAMVTVIGFYSNSVNINFFSIEYMSRKELFDSNYIYSSIFILNVIFSFISIGIYYILLIFFGYKWVIIVSSSLILFFSILKDYYKAWLPEYLGDRIRYNYDIINVYNSDNDSEQVFFSFIMSALINGLYYAFNIYLLGFTKTIYRCTFLGIIQFIHNLGFAFSIILSLYFPSFSLLITGLAAFIGIYPIIFTNIKNEGSNIVSDKRKIEQLAQFISNR